jgi:hypothetical protein
MKIVLYTKGPASWPLRGTAGKVFFFLSFLVTVQPHSKPCFGAAPIIVPDG